MGDGDVDQAGWAATLRRLRPAIAPAGGEDGEAGGWREDLRLFAFTWAAGFVFFLVFLA